MAVKKYLLLAVTLLFVGCASKSIDLAPEAPKISKAPDTAGIISLLSLDRIGHACPCDGTVYTAAHLARPGNEYLFYTWGDQLGHQGTAEGNSYDRYRDLGTLKLMGDTPYMYPKATTLPKRGDVVYWVEFGTTAHEFFLPKVRKAKFLYAFAGYANFDNIPQQGASGSCLLNAKGEVVGIVAWGGIKGGKKAGAAVLLP